MNPERIMPEGIADNPLMRLPPRMRRFVEAYVQTLNAKESYRQAMADPDCGKDYPSQKSGKLLRKPEIRDAIQWVCKQYVQHYKIDRDFVIGRLIAESMMGDDDGGSQGGRLKALEMLGRWMKMFADNNDNETKTSLELNLNIINAARDRVRKEAMSLREVANNPSSN